MALMEVNLENPVKTESSEMATKFRFLVKDHSTCKRVMFSVSVHQAEAGTEKLQIEMILTGENGGFGMTPKISMQSYKIHIEPNQ
jgi:hypothetical protein